MRLIFLNRFYWPDEPATGQLLTDLAECLVKRGHEVTVIASHSGDASLPRREHRAGVEIVRVSGTRWQQGGIAGKATAWVTFLIAATWRTFREARRDDMLVAMTDPPLLGIAAWLVARARGTRVIHWIQDIYPDLAIVLTGHRWLAALRPFRNVAWRGADVCVTLGADMAGVVAESGLVPAKLVIVPNWAPVGVESLPLPDPAMRAAWGLSDRFVVAYSGNLGRVHDLEPVLEVAARLHDEPRIVFVFVGEGPQRESLESASRERGLANILFQPPQPRARLAESLGVADVHLVTLRAGCERYVFPSKLYGITAVGRPVVFIGPPDCELARLVERHELGAAFAPTDVSSLAAALSELAASPERCAHHAAAAVRFAAVNGGAEKAADVWQRLLCACAAPPSARVLSRPD